MKKLIALSASILTGLCAFAGNYDSYKVSVYTRAYEVEKMADPEWLDSTWHIISSQVNVDKIYLETHRDLLIVPSETLEAAEKYFQDRGVEVGGGITYTIDESNWFETFSYSNPEHRQKVKEIAEHTARHFDNFILDDFFFTSSKADCEVDAKGDKSWTDYRLELMTKAGQELVLAPAKAVNPDVTVIIKYPNWYDHFQGLGFDLEHGPQIFDGIWTGTETRDPSYGQHLQNYLGYNIIRYFDNLRPGHNGGGWVDSGGHHMGLDRYAEQLWLTMFAKAPEINLFAYHELIGTPIVPAMHRTPWQGTGTSFDFDAMMQPVALKDGKKETPTTIARAAGYALEQIDPIVGQLGKPVGIKSYKPYHSSGDDFLQNYLGMIGLPMDMVPYFPEDQQVVLLTEQAAADPAIGDKMRAQLRRGGDIVLTTAMVHAIPDVIADIAEVRVTDLRALVDDMGRHGKLSRDILIPQVRYYTNDSWEIVSAGRPLTGGVSGYPILLRSPYSQGNMYVLTIPDDFGNLYDYPVGALNTIRQAVSADMPMYIKAPSKVALMVYDNGSFIVENFNDTPVDIEVVFRETPQAIAQLPSGKQIKPTQPEDVPATFGRYYQPPTPSFPMTIPAHSYRAFKTIK